MDHRIVFMSKNILKSNNNKSAGNQKDENHHWSQSLPFWTTSGIHSSITWEIRRVYDFISNNVSLLRWKRFCSNKCNINYFIIISSIFNIIIYYFIQRFVLYFSLPAFLHDNGTLRIWQSMGHIKKCCRVYTKQISLTLYLLEAM